MENLNAEQVKKALECCFGNSTCAECPYNDWVGCHRQMMKNAIALIKELTEECANLHASCTELERKCASLNDENERLRADKDYWKSRAKESESEYDQAVKRGYNLGAIDYVGSFAERLKAETVTIQDHTGKLGLVVLVGTIDQIAKELTEEKT